MPAGNACRRSGERRQTHVHALICSSAARDTRAASRARRTACLQQYLFVSPFLMASPLCAGTPDEPPVAP